MKRIFKPAKFSGLALAALTGFIFASTFNPETANGQEISPAADLYSTYVWRGVAYAGPSIQPSVEISAGGFTIGAWGSQGIDGVVSSNEYSTGFQEMDLYAEYSFDFGLSLGITDYYYPGSLYFEGDSHAYEINVGYGIENFTISANYILNEALAAGSEGGDLYFEAGYSIGAADLFVGAGDGWHTTDTEFAVVNVGLGTTRDIVITDSFSIPLFGAVVLNPDTEQFYILAGVSF